MYKATYKCRMCGETFTEYSTENLITVLFISAKVCANGNTGEGIYPTISEKYAHNCPDGSIGYADFVGFRKGE